MTFSTIVLIYLVGCFFSFMVLQLCSLVKKEKLNKGSLILGILMSWLVVFGFIFYLGIGFRNHKKKKADEKNAFTKLGDAEMIKITIDNYWVPATMYGEEFDPEPTLPIKGSPLCKVYYDTNNRILCGNCPIHNASFGCNSIGFYHHYKNSEPGKDRKRRAMILGKVFGDIYEELK